MPFRVFSIPVSDDGGAADLLNQCVRRVKVVAIERHLVTQGVGPMWAFCIEYQDGPGSTNASQSRSAERTDYRITLPPDSGSGFPPSPVGAAAPGGPIAILTNRLVGVGEDGRDPGALVGWPAGRRERAPGVVLVATLTRIPADRIIL